MSGRQLHALMIRPILPKSGKLRGSIFTFIAFPAASSFVRLLPTSPTHFTSRSSPGHCQGRAMRYECQGSPFLHRLRPPHPLTPSSALQLSFSTLAPLASFLAAGSSPPFARRVLHTGPFCCFLIPTQRSLFNIGSTV